MSKYLGSTFFLLALLSLCAHADGEFLFERDADNYLKISLRRNVGTLSARMTLPKEDSGEVVCEVTYPVKLMPTLYTVARELRVDLRKLQVRAGNVKDCVPEKMGDPNEMLQDKYFIETDQGLSLVSANYFQGAGVDFAWRNKISYSNMRTDETKPISYKFDLNPFLSGTETIYINKKNEEPQIKEYPVRLFPVVGEPYLRIVEDTVHSRMRSCPAKAFGCVDFDERALGSSKDPGKKVALLTDKALIVFENEKRAQTYLLFFRKL